MIEDKPETVEELVATIKPEIYQSLKSAVEIGKWESGEQLTKEQIKNCLQAIIAYEDKNVELDKRLGYIESAKSGKTPSADRSNTITTDSNNSIINEVTK